MSDIDFIKNSFSDTKLFTIEWNEEVRNGTSIPLYIGRIKPKKDMICFVSTLLIYKNIVFDRWHIELKGGSYPNSHCTLMTIEAKCITATGKYDSLEGLIYQFKNEIVKNMSILMGIARKTKGL
ncbi:hypothetical protein H6G33_10300 [Calothrix sp. FACHB-1219]|uniref:hypothetical protein n=1 Tax=unclassified Calothrix TaxID=2619626 RepID=UPI001684A0D6|nr:MULTISPECIES: hypothetical protein [unclassified Calothrix]MBD2201737.1 hypothetical protein [Calothrix sp. FACHB-168]MBD2217423.1 hypothetical protein [Calothrix sp. FACHB-1219]